jgi:hypothetical protein
MDGGSWVIEHYSGAVAGGLHYDEARSSWAYVVFLRADDRPGFTVVDHDLGFSERAEAVAALRLRAGRLI